MLWKYLSKKVNGIHILNTILGNYSNIYSENLLNVLYPNLYDNNFNKCLLPMM